MAFPGGRSGGNLCGEPSVSPAGTQGAPWWVWWVARRTTVRSGFLGRRSLRKMSNPIRFGPKLMVCLINPDGHGDD